MKALLKRLSPFAPDHSGVVSALFELGGLIVICDAGGCTGNICGFDEPRWFTRRSAVFSAGMRDMDAILGRDTALVEKLVSAQKSVQAPFAVLVGTPVPAVIATDFKALKRMAEKKLGVPVLTCESTGVKHYDHGVSAAFSTLFENFAQDECQVKKGCAGVIGATPLDYSSLRAGEYIAAALKAQNWDEIRCYGMGCGLDKVSLAGEAEKNFVVSPGGVEAARFLERKFGTPWEMLAPWIPEEVVKCLPECRGKRVLISHQQAAMKVLRQMVLEAGASEVIMAGCFMTLPELSEDEIKIWRDEADLAELVSGSGADIIIADRHLKLAVPECQAEWVDFPHFAVSGRLID